VCCQGNRGGTGPTLRIPMRLVQSGRWSGVFLFSCYLALVGGILAEFSLNAHPRFLNQAESIDSQQAILDRRIFVLEGFPVNYTSWRSRILVPYAIKLLAKATGARFSQSYVAVRWISATLALAAFALLAARQAGGGGWFAAAAAGLFALVLFPTFLFLYETPSDFADAFFFSLLTLLALEKRRWLFGLALLVGVTNRESAIFALAVWGAIHAPAALRTGLVRELAYLGALGALSCALVLWLRWDFAIPTPAALPGNGLEAVGQPYTWQTLEWAVDYLQGFFRHPSFTSSLFYLLGYVCFFPSLLWINRGQLPPPVQRAAVAAAGIFLVSIPFGHLPELRVYIPSLVIAVFGAVVVLRRQLDPSQVQPPA
jgi:hypothetical protein